MAGDLARELKILGLGAYVQRCRDAGFHDWASLSRVTEAELAALDMLRGHRRKLQRGIARRLGWPETMPLPTEAQVERLVRRASILEWSTRRSDERRDDGGASVGARGRGRRNPFAPMLDTWPRPRIWVRHSSKRVGTESPSFDNDLRRTIVSMRLDSVNPYC